MRFIHSNVALSKKFIIIHVSNLRGSSFVNVVADLVIIIAAMILLANNLEEFRTNSNEIATFHLEWLYIN